MTNSNSNQQVPAQQDFPILRELEESKREVRFLRKTTFAFGALAALLGGQLYQAVKEGNNFWLRDYFFENPNQQTAPQNPNYHNRGGFPIPDSLPVPPYLVPRDELRDKHYQIPDFPNHPDLSIPPESFELIPSEPKKDYDPSKDRVA